jgi:hypothetical protein
VATSADPAPSSRADALNRRTLRRLRDEPQAEFAIAQELPPLAPSARVEEPAPAARLLAEALRRLAALGDGEDDVAPRFRRLFGAPGDAANVGAPDQRAESGGAGLRSRHDAEPRREGGRVARDQNPRETNRDREARFDAGAGGSGGRDGGTRERDEGSRDRGGETRDRDDESAERSDNGRDRNDKGRDRGGKDRDRDDKGRDRGGKGRDRDDKGRDRGGKDRDRDDKGRDRGGKDRERDD